MDAQVQHPVLCWPDVPAAYGWLSLDARGVWRLHEHGDANAGTRGEPIAHDGLRAFIQRHYTRDASGAWYFQNGPQRVYVTLAAAPYILRWNDTQTALLTQTDAPAGAALAWWLDSAGRLYAQTPLGPGLIDARDLTQTAQRLHLTDGRSLLDSWAETVELPAADATAQRLPVTLSLDGAAPAAPLWTIGTTHLADALHFVPRPQPPNPQTLPHAAQSR